MLWTLWNTLVYLGKNVFACDNSMKGHHRLREREVLISPWVSSRWFKYSLRRHLFSLMWPRFPWACTSTVVNIFISANSLFKASRLFLSCSSKFFRFLPVAQESLYLFLNSPIILIDFLVEWRDKLEKSTHHVLLATSLQVKVLDQGQLDVKRSWESFL